MSNNRSGGRNVYCVSAISAGADAIHYQTSHGYRGRSGKYGGCKGIYFFSSLPSGLYAHEKGFNYFSWSITTKNLAHGPFCVIGA